MAEDDNGQLIKRFEELAGRAERTCAYTETRFLNMAEQSVLLGLRLPVPFRFEGGFPGAERRIAVFGSEELTGYRYESPIACICIRPANARFADELTHRDFLGSLMALGMTREMLGDIVVSGNCGYLFCLETAAAYIEQNLSEVKRTTVRCSRGELPEGAGTNGEERSAVVASERLDAVIAAVYKLSREDTKALCEKGLVFIDSRLVLKAGAVIPNDAVVSVRGKGRFRFHGTEYETKKGKLRVKVTVY